jgi:hypothetical protein
MVTVADSSQPAQTVQMPATLVINDSPIVIAATPAPPAGTVTYPYPAFGFSASGGSLPYTWQATGTVPPGLTVGSDGTVSGTPTAAGSFSFSVTATDSAQTPVSGPALKTQIVISTPGTLVLNAMPAPPAGVGDSAYPPFTFSTTGGELPLSFSVTAGNLPPGLTLGSDGSLGGTPTQVGSFAFTVTVKDSAPTPASSSQSFTISITPPPPPTIANAEAPTGTVGVVYAPFQFSANAGLAPFVWMETGALDGLALSSSGVLSGTPSVAGKFPITLEVTDALNRAAPSVPLIVRVSLARSGAFTLTTGRLTVARSGHTATLLNTGKVLVAGGAKGAADPSAELYDPKTEIFTATGNMTEARIGHTATLLNVSAVANFGKVLIVGPVDSTAELYDPDAGTFTATGSMTQARNSLTATLLATGSYKLGSVLIVGGNTPAAGNLTAELYNPATGTFSATGSTSIIREGHTATQLQDGRVLIAGGGTTTAELYDPKSGTFTSTGGMAIARSGATATLLQDGTVLVFGGDGRNQSAELYDPKAGMFALVGSNPVTAIRQTASLRADGSVLAAGGYHLTRYPIYQSVSAAALFGPESDGFTSTGALNTARDGHTATVLSDGTVLIVGGNHHACIFNGLRCTEITTILSSAEVYK